jgi:hypothetical protein
MVGLMCRYGLDMGSFWLGDKFLRRAVIATSGDKNVQPQLSVVSSISRCLQAPEFLKSYPENRVYVTEMQEAGCYISPDLAGGGIDAVCVVENN